MVVDILAAEVAAVRTSVVAAVVPISAVGVAELTLAAAPCVWVAAVPISAVAPCVWEAGISPPTRRRI